MVSCILKSLVAVFLACAWSAALAAEPPRGTEELMRLSGLWKQVGEMQAQIRAGIEEASRQGPGPEGLGAEDLRQLMTRAADAYSPEKLRAGIAGELAARISAEDEARVLEWLRSDLGRRFTALEERSSDVASQQRIEREAPAHAASLSAARLDRIRRFEQAAHVGKAATDMTINTALGVAYGVMLAAPQGDPALLGPLRQRFESQRPEIARVMEQRIVEALAYIYRDVADEDLDKYAEFAESPAGRRYHEATLKALDRVLAKAAVEMGAQFGRGLGERRRAT
jgi:hypothetical protein